jgi:hypothetical protein
MKSLNFNVTFLLFLLSTSSIAASTTGYHFWYGYKKTDFSIHDYLKEFNYFMNNTLNLNQLQQQKKILVAIPPKNAPSFIPHHFVMVNSDNRFFYNLFNRGNGYNDYSVEYSIKRHWNDFNLNEFKPLAFKNYFQDNIANLKNNHVYDFFSTKLDWSQGHTMFFIGLKNSNLDHLTYLKKIKKHLELVVKSLKKHGLQGFIVITNKNYTVAYLNWKSRMSMGLAYNTPDGMAVLKSSKSVHTTLMYKEMHKHKEETPYSQVHLSNDQFVLFH